MTYDKVPYTEGGNRPDPQLSSRASSHQPLAGVDRWLAQSQAGLFCLEVLTLLAKRLMSKTVALLVKEEIGAK